MISNENDTKCNDENTVLQQNCHITLTGPSNAEGKSVNRLTNMAVHKRFFFKIFFIGFIIPLLFNTLTISWVTMLQNQASLEPAKKFFFVIFLVIM